MPTATDSKVILRVPLSADLYEHYTDEAKEYGLDIEELLSSRLAACREHRASKPLYLDDAQRRELERVLGRNVLHTDDALIQIRNAFAVRIQKLQIQLKPNLLAKLRSRAIRVPWEKFLEERIIHALETYVGLR